MSNNNPWPTLAVVMLAGLCGGFCLLILAPITPDLMRLWSVDAAGIGVLNAAFALTGVVLALPGAWVVQRLGARKAGVVTLGFFAGGLLVGLASPDFAVQVAARILQGTGQAFLAVLGASVIGQTFVSALRGRAMGLYTAATPVAMLAIFNTAPGLVAAGGWRLPFVLVALLALAAIPLWWATVRSPSTAEAGAPPEEPVRWGTVLRQAVVVQTALGMLLMAGPFLTLQAFIPTFLVQQRGFDPAGAASLASLGAVTGLVAAVLGGWLSDLLGNRKWTATVCLAALAGLLALTPLVPTGALMALILVTGVLPAVIGLNLFTGITEALESPSQVGPALGVVSLGQNLGQMVGPLVFGAAIVPWGWTASIEGLAAAAGVGFLVLAVSRRT